ncbi:TetR/AcrR family transcriptional regulator [Gallaecimonas kandeliae]|uniref:TetR/AcrR family transcriptional regulator n=1 Tax=Gallaecimonas kandeliae TaxID=3029055 RepID=UPI00264808DB|nr:TetR/AcrR family transcriptional regulator [Gallaecimonas kandeliae]WKE64056.1 TetR/AcrR family transcriptional regulator [Gallaecimonas kandeliae]
MQQGPDKLTERAERKRQKREAKKAEIAASTLDTLKQLGYANTTLRDIAQQSGLSLGSLTYYFVDKTELITYCVQLYKAQFLARISGALVGEDGPEAVLGRFAEALALSIKEEHSTHRLWYDIRAQALFDPAFRPVVAEIEAKLMETLALAVQAARLNPPGDLALRFAMLEGAFRYQLQRALLEGPAPLAQLKGEFRQVLDLIIRP